MRLARLILPILLGVALVVYALDCGGAMTPEQATDCCNSMPCVPPAQHGQDCCQNMPAMHAPFVKAQSVNTAAPSLTPLAVLRASVESYGPEFAARHVGEQLQVLPIHSESGQTPLRI